MKIGITELIVIFVVALFVIGPDRLPAYARKLGQAMAQFRKYSAEATKDIKESIVEPLEAAQAPLREAVQPFEELDQSVRADMKELTTSFSEIGKPGKQSKPIVEQKPSETTENKNDNQENLTNTEKIDETAEDESL